MKIPIPDDWNGQSWQCVQIEWPNSPQWLALLLGFLSQATRGRFWEESTGAILDAQAVGWQIWDRNYPFRDCEGEPVIDNGGGMEAQRVAIGYMEIDMPCIDISGMLKIEAGVLYARNSCCEWVSIGSFAPGAASEDFGSDPLNPEGDPEFVYSACGKAEALINKLIAVANTAWDARDEPPWTYGSLFHGAHPDLEGGATDFTSAVLLALQLDALSSHEDVFDTLETDKLRAWLATILADDAAGITADEFDDLVNKIYSVYNAINLLDPLGIMKANFWTQALQAIGPGDAANISKLGASNTTADCENPEEPLALFPGFGQNKTWSHVIDFRLATLPAGTNIGGTGHHLVGTGLWNDVGGTQDYTDLFVEVPISGTPVGVIELMAIAFTTLGDDNWPDPALFLMRANNPATNVLLVSDVINLTGDDPSALGTWQITAACSINVAAGAPNTIEVSCRIEHPPDTNPPSSPSVSNILIAIAIAGSGDDPFPELP